jgi:hypothetical protein
MIPSGAKEAEATPRFFSVAEWSVVDNATWTQDGA